MRAVVCEVDLGRLSKNVIEIKKKVGHHTKILVPVKANAYGHGAVGVSSALSKLPVDILGVSSVYEAKEIVRAGIKLPVMVLGLIVPKESAQVVKYGITTTVTDLSLARALSNEAVKQGKIATIHFKVDTGMGRIGSKPEDSVRIIKKISKLPNLRIEGVFTHMPVADDKDKSFSYRQLKIFNKVLEDIENEGVHIPIRHMANSAGVLDLPDTYFDMVRPGILTYGYYPNNITSRSIKVEPIMSLKTHITAIKRVASGSSLSYGRTYITDKETNVITIHIGYADGLSVRLSDLLEVKIDGKKYTVSGRISMDQTLVDIGDDYYKVGKEVIIYDRNDHTVEKVANLLGVIPYEVICALSARVGRVYINEGQLLKNISEYNKLVEDECVVKDSHEYICT